MEWIDAHMHIGDDKGSMAASLPEIESLFGDGLIDGGLVFCMDEKDGIPHGNDRIRGIVDAHDHLDGLFRVDPAVHDPDDLYDRDAFNGFKLHPRSQDFGMQEVYRHLRVIADTGKPALVHTGVGDSRRGRGHPEEVLEAAATHRDVDMVLAHTTKGYFFHAPQRFRDRFKELDNAYMDISLHCTPSGVEGLVDRLGADRVLFASDYPYGHPLPIQQCIQLADIPDDATRQVAAGNAERLFR